MSYTEIDDPTAYFQSNLHTGNSGTNAITFSGNSDLQPDWIWIKERGATGSHVLTDIVRGITKQLYSNDTQAENTNSSSVTAIGSNGFTLGNRADVNNNSDTYVSWNWKAGTSFTNDASATGIGTIDSTGSVNTDAGFSIVSYTGTGSTGTVAHGLGATPSMMIFKERAADAHGWITYHHKNTSAPATEFLLLNTTQATEDDADYFNDTEPTSSVFTIDTYGDINGSSDTYIAYCFAEKKGYSKFGSYTGNGSTDGTFVYTGFKPAFVMCKRTNSTGVWFMCDNKRVGFNGRPNNTASVGNPELSANDSRSEAGGNTNVMDIFSNGFKLIQSGAEINGSGQSFIFMAFAENPFVTSTGVPAGAR